MDGIDSKTGPHILKLPEYLAEVGIYSMVGFKGAVGAGAAAGEGSNGGLMV